LEMMALLWLVMTNLEKQLMVVVVICIFNFQKRMAKQ
jgi:hypothetical protein